MGGALGLHGSSDQSLQKRAPRKTREQATSLEEGLQAAKILPHLGQPPKQDGKRVLCVERAQAL